MRTLRASVLALAATAAGLLGSTQSASAQSTFNFSPSGTGVGLSTTGLVFAPSSALATNISGGPAAIPLTDGETFTLLYQTNLTGLVGQNGAVFQAAIGAGQVTEVALLTEVAHIAAGSSTATFTLAPGGPQQINIYASPTTTFDAAAGTGYTAGTVIATLTPNTVGETSAFTNFGGLQTFNQNGSGFQAGTSTQAVTGSGGFNFSNAVMSPSPLYFNPPTGTPTLTGSTIGGSLNSYFIANPPASLFTNPITSATYVPSIGAINGATGPDFELRVDGFTQSFAAAVPEPASVTLMGLGVIGALVVARRTRARVA